jgi:hypothetical protein
MLMLLTLKKLNLKELHSYNRIVIVTVDLLGKGNFSLKMFAAIKQPCLFGHSMKDYAKKSYDLVHRLEELLLSKMTFGATCGLS